jgi:Protein of unknown function (DUF3108)
VLPAHNTLRNVLQDGPHLRMALAATLLVLCLHAWLLNLWSRAPGPGVQAAPARAMQVRQIVQQATQPTPAAPAQAMARGLATPKRVAVAQPAARPSGVTPADPTAPAAPQERSANTPSAAEPSPEPGGQNVPVFATKLPPPFSLQYSVQRGLVTGRAELRWQLDDGRYDLSLQTRAFGNLALAWTSRGGVDGAGLAPERYTEGRRGREQRAVNFQRDAGRVSFSGPQLEYPLVPGMQDRVSWMVQLASIVAANPALAQLGAQVPIFVVGTRGDAEVWTFAVIDTDALDLPGGTLPTALHLKREPRRPYDAQVEVWLDPTRFHLPVRSRLLVRATGEGTDFVLEQLNLP